MYLSTGRFQIDWGKVGYELYSFQHTTPRQATRDGVQMDELLRPQAERLPSKRIQRMGAGPRLRPEAGREAHSRCVCWHCTGDLAGDFSRHEPVVAPLYHG